MLVENYMRTGSCRSMSMRLCRFSGVSHLKPKDTPVTPIETIRLDAETAVGFHCGTVRSEVLRDEWKGRPPCRPRLMPFIQSSNWRTNFLQYAFRRSYAKTICNRKEIPVGDVRTLSVDRDRAASPQGRLHNRAHALSPKGDIDAGDMVEHGHVRLLGVARCRLCGVLPSKSASLISSGASPRIQSVRFKVRQTCSNVTVEAFRPASRLRSAVIEMPLRAAVVSRERLAAKRAARILAPRACRSSSRV